MDKLLSSFIEIGVTRETLEQHLGHPVKSITEEEFVDLRGIYSGIAGGEISAKNAFMLEEEKPERPSGPVGKEVFTPEEEKKKDAKKDTDTLAEEATLRDVLLKIVQENKGLTVKQVKEIIANEHDRNVDFNALCTLLSRMCDDGDIDKFIKDSIPVYGPMK